MRRPERAAVAHGLAGQAVHVVTMPNGPRARREEIRVLAAGCLGMWCVWSGGEAAGAPGGGQNRVAREVHGNAHLRAAVRYWVSLYRRWRLRDWEVRQRHFALSRVDGWGGGRDQLREWCPGQCRDGDRLWRLYLSEYWHYVCDRIVLRVEWRLYEWSVHVWLLCELLRWRSER